jgi:site-specific DNA-methyltransferase (adenine-specific)
VAENIVAESAGQAAGAGDAFVLHLGDCIEVLRAMPGESVDAIVTDPPYHLTENSRGGHARTNSPEMPHGRHRIGDKGFMGKVWDGGDIAQRVELWAECLRVLKPGAHLLAFSGTRTQHRMVCAIEDAGFDIRDQIGWAYGSGFPKSRNIAAYDLDGDEAQRWAGWGTALKPAWEPICVARKPLAGSVAENVLKYGTGALNIDGCRVATDEALRTGAGGIPCRHDEKVPRGREGEASAALRYSNNGGTNFAITPGPRGGDAAGRWPANLIHDGSAEVVALFPSEAGQSGALKTRNSDAMRNTYGDFAGTADAGFVPHDQRGSAARFFYCAKANRLDRNDGTEALPQLRGGMVSNTSGQHITRRDEGYAPQPQGNHHPTVKPTDLMAYLVRLVTPPGGVVLDPFMGSGSTGKACMREGMRFVGVELSPEYLAIAQARIEHEQQRERERREEASRQMDFFSGEAA